jgi:hypothetical protein
MSNEIESWTPQIEDLSLCGSVKRSPLEGRMHTMPTPWNHNSHFHLLLVSEVRPGCERLWTLGAVMDTSPGLLAQRCGSVVGIDRSPEMAAQAKGLSSSISNVVTEQADFLDAPLESSTPSMAARP